MIPELIMLCFAAAIVTVIAYLRHPLPVVGACRDNFGRWLLRMSNGDEFSGHPYVSGWSHRDGSRVFVLKELRLMAYAQKREEEYWNRFWDELTRRVRDQVHSNGGHIERIH